MFSIHRLKNAPTTNTSEGETQEQTLPLSCKGLGFMTAVLILVTSFLAITFHSIHRGINLHDSERLLKIFIRYQIVGVRLRNKALQPLCLEPQKKVVTQYRI